MDEKIRVHSADVSAFGARAEILRASLEIILLVGGKPHNVYGLLYEDHIVAIRRHGQSGGYELIRKSTDNPVAIYASTGTCIRLHGEFRYVNEHVRLLVRQAIDKAFDNKISKL